MSFTTRGSISIMQANSESEREFFKRIVSYIKLVKSFENPDLWNEAQELIPIEELNIKAAINLSVLESKEIDVDLADLLLKELLHWFKSDFFTWVDIPKCENCGKLPENRGYVPPNNSEEIWGADRVEQYFCSSCNGFVRFPRYKHPKKLMETRRGRCGEWAICFTFICRVMGYDARFVVDWNDHVWTEIFSTTLNRWLHCDSCENICDQPLIYEKGWKKLNNYIIAFSKDEIQDVTWRYTCDFNEVLKRRTLCREIWLSDIIVSLNDKLQKNAPAEYKKTLYHRRAVELAEFLTPPKYDGEHYSGRNSGSLEWRLTRKETEVPEENAYEFKLCCQEIEERHFHIKYNCASDKYVRISDNLAEIESWATYVFSYSKIFRKVEHDWNTAYLCRTKGSEKGLITWKFNFKDSGLIIRTLRATLKSTTFESGKVKWFISTDSELKFSKVYEAKDVVPLKTDEFRGSTNLTISAVLVEGSGNQAWQHAQLFRQPLNSAGFPFEVEIFLERQ